MLLYKAMHFGFLWFKRDSSRSLLLTLSGPFGSDGSQRGVFKFPTISGKFWQKLFEIFFIELFFMKFLFQTFCLCLFFFKYFQYNFSRMFQILFRPLRVKVYGLKLNTAHTECKPFRPLYNWKKKMLSKFTGSKIYW